MHRDVTFRRLVRSRGWSAAIAVIWSVIAQGALAQPTPLPDPANDPETCRAIWEKVGLPERAADDEIETTLVCHLGYVTAHNSATKTPDWVLARMTAADVAGTFKRPKQKFRAETALPAEAARAIDDDYKCSKMDRGHQAASADFSGDEKRMTDTFFFSNTVPQQGIGFNQHIWRELEELVQRLTRERGELIVITGPIHVSKGISTTAESDACRRPVHLALPERPAICGGCAGGPPAVCVNGVIVPAALFKIIYDPALKRANAYVLPNINHQPLQKDQDSLEYLERFRVGIDTVESLTGLRFFTALPPREARMRRENCTATMLH